MYLTTLVTTDKISLLIRKTTFYPGLCTIWLIILAGVLTAQESLTLNQVWDIARHNNLTLKQQEQSIDQAKQEVWMQNTGFLPALSFNSYYQYQSELARIELPIRGFSAIDAGVHNQYDFYALIQQPLFRGLRTHYSVQTAEKKYELQTLQQILQQNALLLQSGQLFFDLQLNLLQQEVLQQSIKRTALQLERLHNLLAAQQISSFDTLEIANHNLDLLNRDQLVQDQYEILQSQLEYLLNAPSLPDIEHRSPVESNYTLKPLSDYQTEALEKRPELRQISVSQQLQRTITSTFKASFYPQLNAQLAYHYARPGVNIFKDEWMKYYTINISLQWELWNWKRDAGKVQQATLEQQKLDLEYQKLANDIKQQVKEVYLYLQSLAQQILLQRRLVEQESERYRITQEKFQQGIVTSLDLNTSEHALTEAQLQLQENYISWQKYMIQLAFVCGTIGTTE
jgi:outer membrane protein